MLIYVDKKKEKAKKIKKIFFTLLCILVILINIAQFKSSLNHPSDSLNNYKSITHSNKWYSKVQNIYLFSAPQPSIKKIIIIPDNINREIITILASILSKLKTPKTYSLLSDVSNKNVITQLTKKILPDLEESNNSPDIIITSDFSRVSETIHQNKMIPSVLSYKTAEKKLSLGEISNYVNTFYPAPPTPIKRLEKEQQSLENFAKDYRLPLKKLAENDSIPNFSAQNFFLKNARICLITKSSNIYCGLSNHTSFLHNFQKASQHISDKRSLKKVVLLTSELPIPPQDLWKIKKDEGIRFSYQKRGAILLPIERQNLTNSKEILYKLKQKAGINPQHENSQMKYYKFKTLEVTLNDNI